MRSLKLVFTAIVVIWISGALQQTLAPRIAIFGAMPDFLLIAVTCLGLFMTRWGGALNGFACGIVQGALAGANLASYAISRTLAGFVVGWLGVIELDRSYLLAVTVTVVSTICARLVFMFGAPPPAIIPFLIATISMSVYNGLLAFPVYGLIKRILDPPAR
ncbi:hypothetical protein BH11ARM1_BH11ARM1_09470 [soil metagenome]